MIKYRVMTNFDVPVNISQDAYNMLLSDLEYNNIPYKLVETLLSSGNTIIDIVPSIK